MIIPRFALLLLAVGACFDPSYNNLQCGTDGVCPSGYTCATGNRCTLIGGGSGVDAGGSGSGSGSDIDAPGPEVDAPPGSCAANHLPATAISGTVFAPNGTLPLPNVTVYVPRTTPGAFPTAQTCGHCDGTLPGDSVARTTTRADGTFDLPIDPGDDIPLVITTGRWRRQLEIPHVGKCDPVTLSVADTSLPKSHTDLSPHSTSVDMPRIAVATGQVESMECLLRQLGVADSEFGTEGDTARHVQLYNGGGASTFAVGAGGATSTFALDTALLGGASPTLPSYDLVYLACDAQVTATDATSMANLKRYADLGGRVMLTHYQYAWIAGTASAKPDVWPTLAKFDEGAPQPFDPVIDHIDESLAPQAAGLASWLVAVGASSVRDSLPLESGAGRATCEGVDHDHVDQLVSLPPGGDTAGPQLIQFSTPTEKAASARCGKVEFSDVHLQTSFNGPASSFPTGCDTTPLVPQDELIAWEIFDIGTCVDH